MRMINGALIDCSRLMEPQKYYFELLDFMAQWKMNTLVLHFADDHGLGVELPGFEDIAMPHAFTAKEIKKLLAYAKERGIQVIPEVETFGHTRYLTDQKKYAELAADKNTKKLKPNAVDPANPETMKVMKKLLKATAKMFPGDYLHIGGNQVDLAAYCKKNDLESPAVVWTDYMNQIIEFVHELDRMPMFWADHAWKDKHIGKLLRKDVVAVWWQYRARPAAQQVHALKRYEFRKILAAPSVACWQYRFNAGRTAMKNNAAVARTVMGHNLMGSVNTIWSPFRYFQKAIYYGLAYGSEQIRSGAKVSVAPFNRKFVETTFKTAPSKPFMKYLSRWPDLQVHDWFCTRLWEKDPEFEDFHIEEMERVNRLWREVRHLPPQVVPEENEDIWNAMVLAGDCAGLCSEWFVLSHTEVEGDTERLKDYNSRLKEVRTAAAAMWDDTRFADDPQKTTPMFSNERSQHALAVLKKLPLL